MLVTTKEAVDRYGCATATLYNKRKRIEALDGIILGNGGSTANLYKTSVLDKLAKDGELGTEARRRVLEKQMQRSGQ